MDFLKNLFSKKDQSSGKSKNKQSPVELIDQLFSSKKIPAEANHIMAIAFLYERLPAPAVWVGPGPNPYKVKGENSHTQQLRMLLLKILPNYQPNLIPTHLQVDAKTLIIGRKFEIGETIQDSDICPLLAKMLVDVLKKNAMLKMLDSKTCYAVAISSSGFVTGEVRIGVLAKK